MCCFIMETRKTDGSCYPPATLQSLVCGLNRELQRNSASFSTMDKGDSRFRPLLKTLDSLSCELHKQGIGAVKNSANIIEKEHEAIFGRRVSLGTLLRRFFSAQYSFMWVSTLLSEVFKISMNWSLPNFSMCLWTLRSMMNLCIIITRNSFLKTTSTGLKISMPGTRHLKRICHTRKSIVLCQVDGFLSEISASVLPLLIYAGTWKVSHWSIQKRL